MTRHIRVRQQFLSLLSRDWVDCRIRRPSSPLTLDCEWFGAAVSVLVVPVGLVPVFCRYFESKLERLGYRFSCKGRIAARSLVLLSIELVRVRGKSHDWRYSFVLLFHFDSRDPPRGDEYESNVEYKSFLIAVAGV